MSGRGFIRKSKRTGATTVEVAACLPLLFLVLFASYEFGRANMLHHVCESAAYEGARVGMVPGATPQKIENAVQGVLSSVGVRNADIRIIPNVINNQTPNIRVEIDIPMRSNTIIPTSFTRDAVFSGKCEMVRETL